MKCENEISNNNTNQSGLLNTLNNPWLKSSGLFMTSSALSYYLVPSITNFGLIDAALRINIALLSGTITTLSYLYSNNPKTAEYLKNNPWLFQALLFNIPIATIKHLFSTKGYSLFNKEAFIQNHIPKELQEALALSDKPTSVDATILIHGGSNVQARTNALDTYLKTYLLDENDTVIPPQFKSLLLGSEKKEKDKVTNCLDAIIHRIIQLESVSINSKDPLSPFQLTFALSLANNDKKSIAFFCNMNELISFEKRLEALSQKEKMAKSTPTETISSDDYNPFYNDLAKRIEEMKSIITQLKVKQKQYQEKKADDLKNIETIKAAIYEVVDEITKAGFVKKANTIKTLLEQCEKSTQSNNLISFKAIVENPNLATIYSDKLLTELINQINEASQQTGSRLPSFLSSISGAQKMNFLDSLRQKLITAPEAANLNYN